MSTSFTIFISSCGSAITVLHFLQVSVLSGSYIGVLVSLKLQSCQENRERIVEVEAGTTLSLSSVAVQI